MGRIDIYPTTALQGPPSAQLGYAEVTANQGSITGEVDLAGLSVTITVPVGRRIRITGQGMFQNTAAGNVSAFRIKEGGTQLTSVEYNHTTLGVPSSLAGSVIISPSAGTHTYNLRGISSAGTTTLVATATLPAFILVEDITGTFWNGVPVTNTPACGVTHSANQSITDNTETTVAFDTERFDTNAMHDNVTNNSRITINTAGVYIVTFTGRFATAADYDLVTFRLKLNATTNIGVHSQRGTGLNTFQQFTVTRTYKFVVTDFVEATVYQDNTANAARNLELLGNISPEFTACWVGLG